MKLANTAPNNNASHAKLKRKSYGHAERTLTNAGNAT
jgi:hypothetical protein